jgi:hypothetical protein
VRERAVDLAAKMYLHGAVRPKRDLRAAEEAHQVDDKEFRSFDIPCRNADFHHFPPL